MLAHKAEEEGVAVAELLAGKPGHVNYDDHPNVIYTAPELAAVGLTEEQVKERGRASCRVGKFLFRANGRAKSARRRGGHGEGRRRRRDRPPARRPHRRPARLRADRRGRCVAMEFAASAEDIARTVHAHPTLSEAVKEAALAVAGRAIHG